MSVEQDSLHHGRVAIAVASGIVLFIGLAFAGLSRHVQTAASPGLANATVVIIRHAEKVDRGDGLTPQGRERAQRYVAYFQALSVGGVRFRPDALYASADSRVSERPRLTLAPLAGALGMPIDQRFRDPQTKALAMALGAGPPGRQILICWHHGEIPKLLRDLGADPEALLHSPWWPGDVFDQAVVLRYDQQGRLASAQVVHEHLMPGDG